MVEKSVCDALLRTAARSSTHKSASCLEKAGGGGNVRDGEEEM